MATETIKVEDGKVLVERTGPNKSNLEVSLSDVESVSFERGGEGEGQSDGTLSLFTKDGQHFPIRVADDEAGKYLKKIYDAQDSKPVARTKQQKVSDGEQIAKPSEQPTE
jgi:hypothetical protein